MSQKRDGKRKSQINKEDLYMMTALWMEQSPWAMETTDQTELRVVGAVFVQTNNRVLSVDCSRSSDGGIVHGAIRALIKYPDKVKGCHVYLSRKPCAHCVKMLVQAAVEKVFYLPFRPEKDDKEENKSVDALFQVSPVSRSFYVPSITKNDLDELETAKKDNPYGLHDLVDKEKDILTKEWNDDWKGEIVDQLSWEEYSDEGIKSQVEEDIERMFQWFRWGVLETGNTTKMTWNREQSSGAEEQTPAQRQWDEEAANHVSRLAQMLSYRTDDPKTGVGCVITIKDEIVAIGWNGFPSKALYGNHPRGSDDNKGKKKYPHDNPRGSDDNKGKKKYPHDNPRGSDDNKGKKKYPHVIHAEQNALMSRNRRDLEESVAFVNKIPCNECLPMLLDLGVKTIVLPHFDEKDKKTSETSFFSLLETPKNLWVYKQVT